MGKKGKKGGNQVKKEKKEIVYRTKEQRQESVKVILQKLSNFQLNVQYAPIRQLYESFNEFIKEGNRLEINIPFPEINRRIKGVLAISLREEVWVNLHHEKF
jgi:hypothetical protein